MKNIGVRAHDISAESIEELIRHLQAYQLSAIQLAPTKSFPEIESMAGVTLEKASELGEYLSEVAIEVTVLGCYVNLSSYEKAVREEAIATFCHYIDLADALQAKYVGTETGSVLDGYTKENYTEVAYGLMKDSLKTIITYAEKKDVKVAIEPGINHPLHNVDTVKRLLKELESDHVVIIFDLVNLLTEDNLSKQQELIEKSFIDFGHKIAVIHVKDCQFIAGEKVLSNLGEGVVDFPRLLTAVKGLKQQPKLLIDELPEAQLSAGIQFLKQRL